MNRSGVSFAAILTSVDDHLARQLTGLAAMADIDPLRTFGEDARLL